MRFAFDGVGVSARTGDTILAAILAAGLPCGTSEFDGAARAGFCLMGSCQDCTMWDERGRRLRGCMTEVTDGQRLRSRPYDDET
ncbi:(2Fe-2S)-binding protein [Salipiger abyssi]|uniref:(2Fe-2S)-binding protein n=1 Tax=Salipiger abyssi TaxID=1250539 RepID=UPI002E28DB66|nr:(2Fe-2S)-binding protein [Salipiger abyssi]